VEGKREKMSVRIAVRRVEISNRDKDVSLVIHRAIWDSEGELHE
jgi:hypothetical protein